MTTRAATIRMPHKKSYPRKTTLKDKIRPGELVAPDSLKGIASVLLVAAFLFLSVYTTFQVKAVADDIKRIETEYIRIKDENMGLRARYDKAVTHKELIKIGKRLGLRPPATKQIITLRKRP